MDELSEGFYSRQEIEIVLIGEWIYKAVKRSASGGLKVWAVLRSRADARIEEYINLAMLISCYRTPESSGVKTLIRPTAKNKFPRSCGSLIFSLSVVSPRSFI